MSKKSSFTLLARLRSSCRDYSPAPVEEEDIEHILGAARQAPTAANRQPIKIIVIHTEGRESEIRRIYDRDWFVGAPLVLCVCAIPDEAWVREQDDKSYHEVDAAIVMDHIIYAATERGLGTCWVAAFDSDAAREILELPDGAEPVVFASIGHSIDRSRAKTRKPLSQLVYYERWGQEEPN